MNKLAESLADNLKLLIIIGGVVAFTYFNCQQWSGDEWRKILADVVAIVAAGKLVPSITQKKAGD